MGVLYIIMALIVMVLNAGMLPEVLRRIFVGAFDFKAIFGGAAGFGSSALMQGIKRGLYSNEAGVGSAPNAAAAADVSTRSSRVLCRCCPYSSNIHPGVHRDCHDVPVHRH